MSPEVFTAMPARRRAASSPCSRSESARRDVLSCRSRDSTTGASVPGRNIGADIDQDGDDLFADVQADALRIIDTILEAEDDRWRETASHRRRRGFVSRLCEIKNRAGVGKDGDVGRGGNRNTCFGVFGLKQQSVAGDRLDVRRTANQDHLFAGTSKHAAEIGAERACAYHRDGDQLRLAIFTAAVRPLPYPLP